MKEGSLYRPKVALSGPKCSQVTPKDALGRPQGRPKRAPREPKMEGKSFENVNLYKNNENLKNDDPPTRKPHFLEVEGRKNRPDSVSTAMFSVLKNILFLDALNEGKRGGYPSRVGNNAPQRSPTPPRGGGSRGGIRGGSLLL